MASSDPHAAAASGADTSDAPSRKGASEGPAPDAQPTNSRSSVPGGEQEEPEKPAPSMPAGEPEAPVGPSRPVGDEPEEAAEPDPGEDHEGRLAADLDELTEKAGKADQYLELAQRTKADFENYRRRASREAAAAQDRGIAKLAKELLPAVDNLDRALEAAEGSGNGTDEHGTLVSGIKLVHADVIAALSRCGIEPFDPKGEQFDPQRHEAVAQQPIEDAQPGTIVEVYQRGYLLGDAVLRPARVVVAG